MVRVRYRPSSHPGNRNADRDPSSAVSPQPISHSASPALPIVAVTAGTERARGLARAKLNRAYTDALVAAGLLPVVVAPLPAQLAVQVLEIAHGLVLTGGADVAPQRYRAVPHPTVDDVDEGRDDCEIALVRAARERRVPTLAICRGIQLANVAFGGTLVQDIPSECPAAGEHDAGAARARRLHPVHVDEGSLLASALGTRELVTNSLHHQALARVGDALRVTARAEDGIIEGAESTDPAWWMIGVQWHPEELVRDPEPWDRDLFAAFAQRCAERAGQR